MELKKTFLFVLLGVLLPNVIIFLASLFFSLGRPFLNLDYMVVGFLFFSRFRLLAFCVLVFFVAVDFLLLVGQVFPFLRVQDVIYLVGGFSLASGYYKAALVVGVGLFLLVLGSFSLGWRRYGNPRDGLVVLNVGLVFYFLYVYGVEEGRDRFWRVESRPIVSSQAVDFYEFRSRAFLESANQVGTPFSPASYPDVNGWSNRVGLNDRILLILNESWGVPKRRDVQEEIIAPVSGVVALEYGESDFVGATIAAEFRELCQLKPNHFNMANVDTGFDGCLPRKLKQLGYSTMSMHGASGLMYDRARWYPRVGFENMIFFESRAWPRRCYSFPGACDLDMRGEVEKYFAFQGKRFFYWLTLNTHSFYDSRDLSRDFFDCERYGVEGESCRNFKLQAQFFSGLAELLKSESMKGVEVVVVGDHSPPIFNVSEKARNYEEDKIAWLRFKVE